MYKGIPYTQGFSISESGEVIDSNGKVRTTYRNGDGYVTTAIKDSGGKWVTVGVHRLLAITYLERKNPNETEVNHIDGNIENNTKENLEWSTPRDNEIHKAVLNGTHDNPKIIGYFTEKKIKRMFSNLREVGTYLNTDIKNVWLAIKTCRELQGWLLKPRLGKGILTSRRFKRLGVATTAKIGIDVYELPDLNLLSFPSPKEAAVFLNAKTSHMLQSLATEDKFRLFKSKFIILKTGTTLPEFTDEDIISANRARGRMVYTFFSKDKSFRIFQSASEFIKEAGLSKKSVTTALKAGKVVDINGWKFSYDPTVNLMK